MELGERGLYLLSPAALQSSSRTGRYDDDERSGLRRQVQPQHRVLCPVLCCRPSTLPGRCHPARHRQPRVSKLHLSLGGQHRALPRPPDCLCSRRLLCHPHTSARHRRRAPRTSLRLLCRARTQRTRRPKRLPPPPPPPANGTTSLCPIVSWSDVLPFPLLPRSSLAPPSLLPLSSPCSNVWGGSPWALFSHSYRPPRPPFLPYPLPTPKPLCSLFSILPLQI